jgi:predicted RNA binding protein YcfA (HicA-like mRNA interferase family)
VTRLPITDSRTMERFLLGLGFVAARHKGSHAFYRHADGRTTTVPHHPGRDLGRPLVRLILHEIDVAPEDYIDWLKAR